MKYINPILQNPKIIKKDSNDVNPIIKKDNVHNILAINRSASAKVDTRNKTPAGINKKEIKEISKIENTNPPSGKKEQIVSSKVNQINNVNNNHYQRVQPNNISESART